MIFTAHIDISPYVNIICNMGRHGGSKTNIAWNHMLSTYTMIGHAFLSETCVRPVGEDDVNFRIKIIFGGGC